MHSLFCSLSLEEMEEMSKEVDEVPPVVVETDMLSQASTDGHVGNQESIEVICEEGTLDCLNDNTAFTAGTFRGA